MLLQCSFLCQAGLEKMENVKQAVFDLIEQEQDFEQLQLESETQISSDSTEKELSTWCLRKAIEEQANAGNLDVAVCAPTIVAKRICQVIGNESKTLLLPREQLV